ncbi:hypothetical protein FJU08_12840 [Martelella alba]|uniref:Uncharacterized protein n=1 Tax=Martelella alba TaxID=2590451 RepID=A0A506UD78_9HYPH|nr:hypothetical protein [Martelella alba]TPW29697.1 hypothetical protein FJU08_12840 [Martelella alba]
MARRVIPFTADSVRRVIKAVKSAGVEIRTVSVRQDGTVVINGDNGENQQNELVDRSQPENLSSFDDYRAWRDRECAS